MSAGHGARTDASRQVFLAAARALAARGADAVVLGCTELGLLVHEHDVPGVPLLGTTTDPQQRSVGPRGRRSVPARLQGPDALDRG